MKNPRFGVLSAFKGNVYKKYFAKAKIQSSKVKNMVTSLQQLDENARYTYSEYSLWKLKERVELIVGRLFPMAAPSTQHQLISGKLHLRIGLYVEKKPCYLFAAPFDVRLASAKNGKIDTVVQPDLCVICDRNKLDKHGCVGAPDLVVEILSRGNSKKEMVSKYALYEAAGVREYWIIDPEHCTVLTYHLDETTQLFVASSRPLADDEHLKSRIFEGLTIDLSEIFSEDF